ncbi:MAG TPA: ribosome recycling factor [Desulfomicrobiaceae bacterium]|nr:ribosome recycling factor [Desulfomicrobiaceae bacterium]
MDAVFDVCKERMQKVLDNLDREFGRLRTGRASTTLVDNIRVEYYGSPTPLNQVASVSIPDSRTIAIQPWDRSAFGLIEKAIMKSDLGLNPVNDGKIIRISIPPLTEERRKDLVKMAKKYTEEAKVAVRNIRRDENETLKKMKNDKDISEDELHRGQDEIQKITDAFIEKTEVQLKEKEKEIMEI